MITFNWRIFNHFNGRLQFIAPSETPQENISQYVYHKKNNVIQKLDLLTRYS